MKNDNIQICQQYTRSTDTEILADIIVFKSATELLINFSLMPISKLLGEVSKPKIKIVGYVENSFTKSKIVSRQIKES